MDRVIKRTMMGMRKIGAKRRFRNITVCECEYINHINVKRIAKVYNKSLEISYFVVQLITMVRYLHT